MTQPVFLSTREVASRTGLCVQYIGYAIANGKLKATRRGRGNGRWFVRPADLEKWRSAVGRPLAFGPDESPATASLASGREVAPASFL